LIERYSQRVSLLIPASCVEEVREHLPGLCRKRRWDAAVAVATLEGLIAMVNVVENAFLADLESEAKRRIGRRDLSDWPVVALALAVKAPVWTEDKDFFGSGLATWTSETVELYLAQKSQVRIP
jgi:predicted nucleic acid-binding protein